MPKKKWRDGNTLLIQVTRGFIYDAEITNCDDLSRWMKHLWEKNWWGQQDDSEARNLFNEYDDR